MARRKFSDMQTEEQRYAATQAAGLRQQADRHERQAQTAAREVARGAWDRRISEAEVAPIRRNRAEANRLREQADAAEAEAKPMKRGWFR